MEWNYGEGGNSVSRKPLLQMPEKDNNWGMGGKPPVLSPLAYCSSELKEQRNCERGGMTIGLPWNIG